MTDTNGRSTDKFEYRRAEVISNLGKEATKTNGETPTPRVTVVPDIKDRIKVRIVPHSPQTSDDQVRTD